jgi:hypothetical protein
MEIRRTSVAASVQGQDQRTTLDRIDQNIGLPRRIFPCRDTRHLGWGRSRAATRHITRNHGALVGTRQLELCTTPARSSQSALGDTIFPSEASGVGDYLRRSETESLSCFPRPTSRSGKSWAAELARVVLASGVYTLYQLDADWTLKNMLVLFDWKVDPRRAQQAWHGYLYGADGTNVTLSNSFPITCKHSQRCERDLGGSRTNSASIWLRSRSSVPFTLSIMAGCAPSWKTPTRKID